MLLLCILLLSATQKTKIIPRNSRFDCYSRHTKMYICSSLFSGHIDAEMAEGAPTEIARPTSTEYMQGNEIYGMANSNNNAVKNKIAGRAGFGNGQRKVAPSVIGDFVLKTPGYQAQNNKIADNLQLHGNNHFVAQPHGVLKTPSAFESSSDDDDEWKGNHHTMQTLRHPNFKKGIDDNKKDSLDEFIETKDYIGGDYRDSILSTNDEMYMKPAPAQRGFTKGRF